MLTAQNPQRLRRLGLTLSAVLVLGAAPSWVEDMMGTSGDDFLQGTTESDSISGLEGKDVITGLRDSDFLDGGPGDDVLDGGAGDDSLVGDDGNNQIRGSAGRDYIEVSGTGSDRVFGGGQRDQLVPRYEYGEGESESSIPFEGNLRFPWRRS